MIKKNSWNDREICANCLREQFQFNLLSHPVLWTPAKLCGFPHRDVERGKAEISPLSTSAGGSPQPAAAQPTVGGGAPWRLYPAAGGLGRVCAKFRGETRAARAHGRRGRVGDARG